MFFRRQGSEFGSMSQVGATMEDVETDNAAIERALRTLDLSAYAKRDEIQRAWRAKAYETHPDRGGNASAFQKAQAAVKMLLAEENRDYFQTEDRNADFIECAPSQSAQPTTFRRATPSFESSLPRRQVFRRPWLLVAAIFGCLIAPHFHELGLTWEPAPFHDFCEIMESLDWVFFAGWLFIRKPVFQKQRRR